MANVDDGEPASCLARASGPGLEMRAVFDRLPAQRAVEARAGATIVLWSEANGHVLAPELSIAGPLN